MSCVWQVCICTPSLAFPAVCVVCVCVGGGLGLVVCGVRIGCVCACVHVSNTTNLIILTIAEVLDFVIVVMVVVQ